MLAPMIEISGFPLLNPYCIWWNEQAAKHESILYGGGFVIVLKLNGFLLGRTAFSIKTVLQLKAQCIHFTCIMDPSALYHPYRLRFTFTANHQKHGSAPFIKCVIDKITLQTKKSNINLSIMSSFLFFWIFFIVIQRKKRFFFDDSSNIAIIRSNFQLCLLLLFTCFQSSLFDSLKWSSFWSNHWSGGNSAAETLIGGVIKFPPSRRPFQNTRQPHTDSSEINKIGKTNSNLILLKLRRTMIM